MNGKQFGLVLCVAVLGTQFLLGGPAFAQKMDSDEKVILAPGHSPVGRWKTFDDETGEAKAIVEIWEEDGVLYGRVVQTLQETEDGKPHICEKCEGELKGVPVVGLRIIWDMERRGGGWEGGRILDPENGKIYRTKMSLNDAGKALKVRGFIGISLLGRTQIWQRVE